MYKRNIKTNVKKQMISQPKLKLFEKLDMSHRGERFGKDECRRFVSYFPLVDSNDVRILVLSSNNIDDECSAFIVKIIEELTALRYLDLSNNKIGLGFKHIFTAPIEFFNKIVFLDLSANFITDESAIVIFSVMINMKNLNEIRLAKNRIGDQGLSSLTNITQESSKSLKLIDLRENIISSEGVKILVNYIKFHQRLTIFLLDEHTAGLFSRFLLQQLSEIPAEIISNLCLRTPIISIYAGGLPSFLQEAENRTIFNFYGKISKNK